MNKLAEIRTDRLMTQDELAKKAGVSRTTISLIENGHVNPNPITKKKIANVLDWSVQTIFPEGDA